MPLNFDALGQIGTVTASLVVNSAGDHISKLGTSKGLGNQADLELLIWLRRRSTAVLTSGLTARVEQYKLPSHALLAILTRQGVPHLSDAQTDRVLFLPPTVASYAGAVTHLEAMGHTAIHTEFGPQGFIELVAGGVAAGLISSPDANGVEKAADRFGLIVERLVGFQELTVAVVAGRGSDGFGPI